MDVVREYRNIIEGIESGDDIFFSSGKFYKNDRMMAISIPDKNYRVLSLEGAFMTPSLNVSGPQMSTFDLTDMTQTERIEGERLTFFNDKWITDSDLQLLYDRVIDIQAISGHWNGSVLHPNGKFYLMGLTSSAADAARVYDPIMDTFDTIELNSALGGYGIAVAQNGLLYYSPGAISDSIPVIDPNTNEAVKYISVPSTNHYDGPVAAPNGKIYFMPSNATNIMVVDTLNDDEVEFIEHANIPGGSSKWRTSFYSNGKIYGIPAEASSILVINTEDHEDITLLGSFPGGDKWRGGVVAPNGKIFCSPSFSHKFILVIDSNDDSFRQYPIAFGNFTGAIYVPLNNRVYFMPRQTDTEYIMSMDADTEELKAMDIFVGGASYTGGGVTSDGVIYLMPGNRISILELGIL